MLYYLGKGTDFKKEDCKEYKTLDRAMKAAAKDESFAVWDEEGTKIGSLTDDVPEGALNTNPDGSVPAFDENGSQAGTVDAETVAAVTGDEQKADGKDAEGHQNGSNEDEQGNEPTAAENDVNEEDTTSEEEDEVIAPQGEMKVTVICDGTLNLRRSASWDNNNICGRASRGQSYYVKEIHKVKGKKMVRTIDDLFLSGESEHVQFEQLQ